MKGGNGMAEGGRERVRLCHDGVAAASSAFPHPPSDVDIPIAVENLTVAYDARPALRSVSFEVRRGQTVGIIGPNGAGKSTLLKCILGLIRPDLGEVRIFGGSVGKMRKRIAYVPQTEAVDWDFPVTVHDVVLMGRTGLGPWWQRPSCGDREIAGDMLHRVGMQDFRDRHIRQLSGGQQRRVFLARALCQQADLMLLDEPFTGVDAATEQAIVDLMDGLAREGKTLIVVHHDLSVLDRFEMLLLLNQRVVAFGPTGDVATPQNLGRTYGGRLSLLEQADEALQDRRGTQTVAG